jgi:hypothetical protein
LSSRLLSRNIKYWHFFFHPTTSSESKYELKDWRQRKMWE